MRKSIIRDICLVCLSMVGATISGAFARSGNRAPVNAVSHSYALIVGISNYKYIRPLSFADKDAQLFRDYLQSPGGGSLPDSNIFCLLNEDARAANFWVKGMSWLRSKQLKQGDRLFIYLAGHGDAISSDEYFFLTYDCNPAGDKNNYIVTGNIQLFNLKSRIAALTGSGVEVLLIMDACRTNELPGGAEGQRFLSTAVSEQQAGETVMLAAAAGQESIEDSRIGTGHGLFTYNLIDGLSGGADKQGNGIITLSKIQSWVTNKVQTEAKERYQQDQRPFFCCTANGDKVIAHVDSAFLRQWTAAKQVRTQDNDLAFRSVHDRSGGAASVIVDTQLVELYNRFTTAIKATNLIGDSSADSWYSQMASRFPNDVLTTDAKYTLVTDWIDFAQDRINLLLEDKDSASVSRMRSQYQQLGQSQELQQRMNSLQKITSEEYGKIAGMLGRAIDLIGPEDSALAKALLPKYYFYMGLGSIELRKDKKYDVTTARKYLAQAYSLDTGAAYIQLGFAYAYWQSDRYDSVVKYAKLAIRQAPRWAKAYVMAAAAYMLMGNATRDSAKSCLLKAFELDPNDAATIDDIGLLYLHEHKPDSAEMTFRKAIRLFPDQPGAYFNLGRMQLGKRNYDSASRYFERSIACDPGVWQTYENIAEIYAYNEIIDSAEKYYRLTLRVNPYDAVAFGALGDMADAKGMPADTVLYYLRKANTMDPQFDMTYMQMAGLYAELGQVDTALVIARRGLALNRTANILYYIAYIFDLRPNSDDSINAYLHEAMAADSNFPYSYDAIATQKMNKAQHDSAVYYERRAVSLMPANSTFLLKLADAYSAVKKYDSSAIYFRAASRHSAYPARVEAVFAYMFVESGHKDSALIHLRYASRSAANDPKTLDYITSSYYVLGNKDSSLHYVEKMKTAETGIMLSCNLIGTVYSASGQYDSAILYFQKAVDKHEYSDSDLIYFAQACLKKRDPARALSIYLQAVKEFPPDSIADFSIACIYSQQGKKPEALAWLEKSLQSGYKDYKNLSTDTDLTNIRQDSAFAALMKKYFPAQPAK